ncbi:MAG: AAA family ATPase [Anaerolineales bacterium]
MDTEFPYTRIAIIGSTGAGKSTLAKRLAQQLALEHIELDALNWRQNWQTTPPEEFQALVEMATRAPRWVTDGNYSQVRHLIWSRAQAVIWLDYPLWTVFWRLTFRIFRRWWRQELLWGSNYESLWHHFKIWSEDSLWHWLFKNYWRRKREYTEWLSRPEYHHLYILHFRQPEQTEKWLGHILATRKSQ